MTTNQSVSTTSPLMQAVHFEGGIYFTSNYFHKMYASNGGLNGKYERHGDFMRLIRSVPAYDLYIERNDIVEIHYLKHNNIKANNIFYGNADIALLIKTNSYKPIMLINETAQAALTHHLDDEISKLSSVKINSYAAKVENKNKPIASLSDTLLFADFAAKHLGLSDEEKIKNISLIAKEYGLPLFVLSQPLIDGVKIQADPAPEPETDPVPDFLIRNKVRSDKNKEMILDSLKRKGQSVSSLMSSKGFRSMSRKYVQNLINELCKEGRILFTKTDKLKGNEKTYSVVER